MMPNFRGRLRVRAEAFNARNRAFGNPATNVNTNAEVCDFPGLGLHSFRRANITRRQEVGGSAIEACKIPAHHDLEMTSSYTFVAPERQNELTRRIQQKLPEGGNGEAAPASPAPEGQFWTRDRTKRRWRR